MEFGTQEYPWLQHYHREGKDLWSSLDEAFGQIAETGLTLWESGIGDEDRASTLARLLPKYGLRMLSYYDNPRLHEDDWLDEVGRQVARAGWARELGCTIFVANPMPIAWNSPDDKTDAMLAHQIDAMRVLSEELAGLGIAVAYHVHTPEFRAGAREMLAMLGQTNIGLCFEPHWTYRGSDDSSTAVDSVLALFGERIVSTHLRQSHGGVWSECLEDGDLDYRAIGQRLRGFDGPHILETAIEEGTPYTMSFVECHRRSLAYAQAVFESSREDG